MKKLFLGLLLFSSITAWAQNPDPLVQFSCPELPHVGQAAARQQGNSMPPEVFPAPLIANRPSPNPGPMQPSCSGVINVNIHFMLRLDGTGNFNETDDGAAYKPWNANGPQDPTIPADTANNGYTWAQRLVTEMNIQASTNPLNGYPTGTSTPAKKFSFALNGVYFHRVSDTEYNIYKTGQIGYGTTVPFDRYGVNKATEINMFVSGDYKDTPNAFDIGGIACTLGYNPAAPSSYWVKLFNTHLMYEWRQVHNGDNVAFPGTTVTQNSYKPIANSFGHEIGHVTGLLHTFDGANGCADAAVSARGQGWNNLMDQTGANGTSLTPCQLGVVNYNLYNPNSPADSFHNFLSPSFCSETPPRAFFVMHACLNPGNVRMDSRGTFMADQMTVTVYTYDATATTGRGTLLATYTSNVSRGGRWNLASIYRFVTGQQYYVELTARRNSGQSHTRGQIIRIYGAFEGPCGPMQAPAQP